MAKQQQSKSGRRQFLRGLWAVPVAAVLAACGRLLGGSTPEAATSQPLAQASPLPTSGPAEPAATQPAPAQPLEPTPSCPDDDEVTPPQTEGPFYTPNSPQRTSLLEPGMEGARIVVTGQVLTTGCAPVAGALVDFWQADGDGVYDNAGYRLRGHQFTDEAGRYFLETIVPGLYPGRTRHFHVKVQAPNQPVLTTQLYFPGEAANEADRIFHPDLLLAVAETAEGQAAVFDFVLEVA